MTSDILQILMGRWFSQEEADELILAIRARTKPTEEQG